VARRESIRAGYLDAVSGNWRPAVSQSHRQTLEPYPTHVRRPSMKSRMTGWRCYPNTPAWERKLTLFAPDQTRTTQIRNLGKAVQFMTEQFENLRETALFIQEPGFLSCRFPAHCSCLHCHGPFKVAQRRRQDRNKSGESSESLDLDSPLNESLWINVNRDPETRWHPKLLHPSLERAGPLSVP